MQDIQEFVGAAAQRLGMGTGAVEDATGGLLQLIQKQAGEGDFSKLVDSLPGAKSLLGAGSGSGGGIGGMVGGLGKSLLGDKLGGTAGVLAMLQKTGLDLGQAGQFVSMFLDFARDKAGDDVVGRILGSVPELKKLAG